MTKNDIHIGRILLVITAIFLLAAVNIHIYRSNAAKMSDYSITSERTDEEYSAEIAESGKAEPVNINTASAEDLTALDGVGDVLAQRIVEYREANGGFKTKDEIKNVSGIGEGKYADFENMITIGD